jgi:hypothetical protein
MSSRTLYIPRVFGGVIILHITPPPTNAVCLVRSGGAALHVRSGMAAAEVRNGQAIVKVREP